MELRLPKEKLQRVRAVIQQWLGQKAAKWRDLESLVGLLQHAVKVVHSSHSFVQCIILPMASVKKRDRFIRLNTDFRSDVQWWCNFMEGWNGVGILASPETERVELVSDASGS